MLYCSLVRPILEYSSIVWSPHYTTYIHQIETVQHIFLRYIAFKMGIQSQDEDYTSVMRACCLTPLVDRRAVADQCFLHKLLNGVIDCPPLLQGISLNVPQFFARSPCLFHVPFAPTNYLRDRPLLRLPRDANLILQESSCDLFADSLRAYRGVVRNFRVDHQ